MLLKSLIVKRILFWLLGLIAVVILLMWLFDYLITSNARGKLYDDVAQVPKRKVALVLGTSPIGRDGNTNVFFKHRIDAAAQLYKAGKVKYLLLSGDNHRNDYNEPVEMQKALMAKGVPASALILDYAGFRTLDSVVRALEVFGQDDIIIVSQKFHNERAIYLAEHYGMKAIGLNAKDAVGYRAKKVSFREFFARTKVFVDFIFGKEPKYLGEKIQIK